MSSLALITSWLISPLTTLQLRGFTKSVHAAQLNMPFGVF
jgi:hypothetical protein